MARSFSEKVILGRSGLRASRLGLGSSFGLEASDVEWAADRGVNYFYWGSNPRPAFGKGMAAVAKRDREGTIVVVQSYSRAAFFIRPSLEIALRRLGLDHTDFLLLGWWNQPPPRSIVDAALSLKEAGKARSILISCHDRKTFEKLIADPAYGGIMVRYNAAHPGAEREVFPYLDATSQPRPGVVTYTATRWGGLLDPKLIPASEPAPRASDCYRFAMTHRDVDVTIAGCKNRFELAEALAAVTRGPMDEDELAWMKRVGAVVRDKAQKGPPKAVQLLDKWMGAGGS